MASSAASATTHHPAELRGRTREWGQPAALLLAACVLFGLWLRLRGLAAEGFADDEVHKWLAANRYLAGDFGGDDVEHPMLMKSLVALAVLALPGVLAPETLTRLPSALAGGLTVWATALLGRRLFGRAAGLLGAALLAFSTTAIGYHRIAKEDTLLGLFLVLCLWCLAEAKAAADDGLAKGQRRWELRGAAALGAAFASKYFIFYFVIPVVAYLWLWPRCAWRVPLRRWLWLVGVSLAVFLALNFTPLMPSTYAYMASYIRGDIVGGDRGVSESLLFMGRLYGNLAPLRGDHPPPWFFLAFAGVKFAPVTALLGAAGLGLAIRRRAPAHRVVLVWLAVFYAFSLIAGAKYGRFFVSVMPAFLLLAAHAGTELAAWVGARIAAKELGRATRVALATAGLLAVAPEAHAAFVHAPHQRLYVSAFAGGDRNVSWFLPHCDYFDAGIREAVAWVAAHAEPEAEVASEVDWTVRLYAARDGRPELVSSPILPGRGCRMGRPCYVLVQPGRIYRHNQAAIERLARAPPAHVELVRGEEAVRVYRLAPGEPLFPPEVRATEASRAR
jgi:4-amino-4-deoxy-L-arabinose transferase-like glycosyltransferase